MIPDLDIWRSAQALIKQHGQDAPVHAAMRADALLDKGDLSGEADRKGGGGIVIQGTAGGGDGAVARKPQMGHPNVACRGINGRAPGMVLTSESSQHRTALACHPRLVQRLSLLD